MPWRILGAGGAEAIFVSGHVIIPERPFLNIRDTELPVLIRLLNPGEEAFALLLLRQMQVELDDAGAVLGARCLECSLIKMFRQRAMPEG